jgi:hypothetical protein
LGNFAINSGCWTIHSRYFWIASLRLATLNSARVSGLWLYGFPQIEGRAM